MPNPSPNQAQANFLLPKELEEQVIDHWHAERLPSKTAAYIDLLKRGLAAKAQEKEASR